MNFAQREETAVKRRIEELSADERGLTALVVWRDEIDGKSATCYGIGNFMDRVDDKDDGPVLVFENVDYIMVHEARPTQLWHHVYDKARLKVRIGRVFNQIVHLDNPKEPTTISTRLRRLEVQSSLGKAEVFVLLREKLATRQTRIPPKKKSLSAPRLQ